MTPPRITFDDGEITLTLAGFGAGWTFEQFGHVNLFDQAQVQFPADWSDLHVRVATQVVDTTWRLRSTTYLEHTLQAGISYSLADGTSGQMSATSELIEHLMRRPLVSMDGILTVRLNGEVGSSGFTGEMFLGLGLRGHF